MLRTAFSTIIRESNDYTVVLMDASGQRIADCRAGIPAFAVAVGALTRVLLHRFPPETWREGDCVITNDPWIATGHLPDVAMVTPIFYGASLVGFAGTAAHVPDIGGTPTMGPTELISEGVLIPPVHLYRGGLVNDALLTLLRSNVRLAEQVWGDLQAQLAANSVCQRRALEFLQDAGWNDFTTLARAVQEAADRSMRRGIAGIPDGRYCSVLEADGVEGAATHIECAITVRADRMEISYAGTSNQVRHAVNCTLSYTTAYSLYPVKLLIDPFTRSNDGTYRAISVNAPRGSILNPEFPAPVLARHLTGHLLSCAIYRALAEVLPDAVIADSGGAPALRAHFAGTNARGEEFGLLLFASGGMGASSRSDGLSTTAFPTNSGGGSVEALEVSAPLLFTRKTFRADSGGAGRRRGGLGQDLEVRNINPTPVRLTLLGDRERHPPLGVMGGRPGASASAEFDDGRSPSLKSVTSVAPGVKVSLSFAGGGGYGDPGERPQEAIAEDLAEGLITTDGARREYGVDAVASD
jgi:N-methylhydantoinase B